MPEYHLNDSIRSIMATKHRAVQAAISTLANRHFSNTDVPRGIGFYQGGVNVNGREIFIRLNHVTDEKPRSPSPTREEQAVISAIYEIAEMIEKSGIESLVQFGECQHNDPLRAMFDYKFD